MCGVAFLWRHSRDVATDIQVQAALSAMRHRGPDGIGIESGKHWAMGHVRLSIIDIKGSRQPMVSPNGRYVLSFNGEIYNYKTLRSTLSARWDFYTQGDTEVLLAGLVLDGESFVEKLSGMWAFALWDTLTNKLLLSRDRLGEKPLYYRIDHHGVQVASEIPALQALSQASWEENKESLRFYFQHGYFQTGCTLFKDVHELPPAHNMTLDVKDGRFESNSYWSIPTDRFNGTREQAGHRLRELIQDAVESRMVADVDVGLLLSGGIDSSLLLALTANINLPTTFTLGFSSKSFDESTIAKATSELFGATNISKILDISDPHLLRRLLTRSVGQPFGDVSLLPTAMICELTSDHVKVVLGGDGADELFGGYQRYQGRLLFQKYSQLPELFKKSLRKVIKALPASHSHHSRSVVKKAQLFLELEDQYLNFGLHEPPRTLGFNATKSWFPHLYEHRCRRDRFLDYDVDEVMKMMLDDLTCYLPQDILLKSDRASMSHSLELRSPFLDHELVGFAMQLPRLWHRRYGSGKRMLREEFASLLPDSLWKRRKQGFSVPLGEWFCGALGSELMEFIHTGSFDDDTADGLKSMLKAHRSRALDYGLSLWPFYSYAVWRRHAGLR